MNQTKTDRTIAHIIAASAPLFNKKGYAGTSIKDLTDATKLTRGSIYGNFENKEEVALAALDYNIGSFCDELDHKVNEAKTTKDKLIMFVKAFHSSVKANFPEGGCPIQNTLCDADDTMESLRIKAAEALNEWKRAIVGLIEKGMNEGVIKPNTDARTTAWHLIALCEFGILLFSAFRNQKHTDDIVKVGLSVVNNILVEPDFL